MSGSRAANHEGTVYKVKNRRGEVQYRAEVTVNGRRITGPRVALLKDARPALWAKVRAIAAQPTPEEAKSLTPVSSLPNTARSPNSKEVFRCAIEAYAPAIGHLYPHDVTVEILEAASASLPLSAATVNRYQREIVKALRRAGRTLKPRNLEESEPDVRVLSPLEQKSLEDAASNERSLLAIQLLLDTGLRPGEVCGLKHSDRFEDGIWVKRSRTTEVGKPVDKNTKTDRSRAWVPLTSRMQAAIGSGKGYVLAGPTGKPWNTGNLRRAVQSAAFTAGLDGVTSNDLRHTAAVNMLAAGNDPATVASITRHSVEVLLKIYYRGSNDLKREAMRRTEARLQPQTTSTG